MFVFMCCPFAKIKGAILPSFAYFLLILLKSCSASPIMDIIVGALISMLPPELVCRLNHLGLVVHRLYKALKIFDSLASFV